MLCMYLAIINSPEDKRKFECIYIEYSQTMYYAANRILKDSHAAEDAVHQSFLRVINQLEKINANDCHKTRAFLVVIAEHIAIDIYRKRKRESTVSFDEIEIYVQDNKVSVDCTDDVTLAISQLPVNYSTVLRLKFSQGYTDAEISEILHINEDNVRKRISRAKKKLAQILKIEVSTDESHD